MCRRHCQWNGLRRFETEGLFHRSGSRAMLLRSATPWKTHSLIFFTLRGKIGVMSWLLCFKKNMSRTILVDIFWFLNQERNLGHLGMGQTNLSETKKFCKGNVQKWTWFATHWHHTLRARARTHTHTHLIRRGSSERSVGNWIPKNNKLI